MKSPMLTNKKNRKKSAANVDVQKQNILDILENNPSTAAALAIGMEISVDSVRNRLRALKDEGKVYVCEYINRTFTFEKVYTKGNGIDVRRPSLSDEIKRGAIKPLSEYHKKKIEPVGYRLEFFDDFWHQVISRSKSC